MSSQTESWREWLCGRVFAACVFYAKVSMETRVHGSGEREMVFVGVN